MEFPKTTKKEDTIAYEEGLRIFGELRKKYCNDSTTHLDIILNSLCAALVRHFKLFTLDGDAKACSRLVEQIIYENLKKL
jgi:ribosomal protein L17